MWTKLDDGWWKNHKLRALPRSARGLLADILSYCGDLKKDGWIPVTALPQIECSATDPDFKSLVRAGILHRKGDDCPCLDKREWEWPAARGYLVHDWLDYNPSRSENDVARAKKAELRDPALRAFVRARDFGRCRYCHLELNPTHKRGPLFETLDHVDPLIAAGADNLVIACKPCNSRKKQRTPEQALMILLDVADVRAAHYSALGVPDPDLATDSEPFSEQTQIEVADTPGRVGSGSGPGRDGTGPGRPVIGPPTTRRDSLIPNPYTRAGHGDPALDLPPPEPVPRASSPPPALAAGPAGSRPAKRKPRRRR